MPVEMDALNPLLVEEALQPCHLARHAVVVRQRIMRVDLELPRHGTDLRPERREQGGVPHDGRHQDARQQDGHGWGSACRHGILPRRDIHVVDDNLLNWALGVKCGGIRRQPTQRAQRNAQSVGVAIQRMGSGRPHAPPLNVRSCRMPRAPAAEPASSRVPWARLAAPFAVESGAPRQHHRPPARLL